MVARPKPILVLDEGHVKEIHRGLELLYSQSGDPIDPPGVRDENLLFSACSRPHTGLGSQQKYRTIYSKSAALFHSLTKNHAFHNGNKRVALACLIIMLARNRKCLRPEVTDDELFHAVVAMTDDTFVPGGRATADEAVKSFAAWLRKRTTQVSSHPSEMSLDEFLKKAELAGCSIKASGGSYVIATSTKSVRVGQDSTRLPGRVVRKYMKILGLTGTVTYDEFEAGVPQDQDQVRRFRRVLDRLGDA